MSLEVGSPVEGLALPLTDVPDPVFSQAMVGPGTAVRPTGGPSDAVAPIDGTVETLHPHAFVVAVERQLLPEGPFRVQLEARDPYPGTAGNSAFSNTSTWFEVVTSPPQAA